MNYPSAIHSQKFKKIHSHYRAYLSFLEDVNFIERNDFFKVGEQSYLYQFTFYYHQNLFYSHIIKNVNIPYDNDIVINGDIANNYMEDKVIEKLKLYLFYLKFDSKAANQLKDELFITRFYNPEFDMQHWDWFVTTAGKWEYKPSPKVLDRVAQYNFETKVIDMINDHTYYCHTDTSGWRLHSPLTILPREYRKFITFRGQELYSIDLKCSQVFLTLKLFTPEFWDINSPVVNISTLGMEHLFNNQSVLKRIQKAISNLAADYENFRVHCCAGSIYEYMQEEYYSKLGLALERDDVKTQFFLTLFTSNKFLGSEQANPKKLFKKIFPTVYNVFKAIKTERKESLFLNVDDAKTIEKFSSLLPIMLQRLESLIFLKTVTTKIVNSHPEVPLITLHDSLNTTKEHVEFVKNTLHTEIEVIMGYSPTLKIFLWAG